MAKCKDCLHMELCARDERLTDFTPEQEALCQFFVDRHRYVVREKGEWERKRVAFHIGCTACGCYVRSLAALVFLDAGELNFCPNCGADMRKGENG